MPTLKKVFTQIIIPYLIMDMVVLAVVLYEPLQMFWAFNDFLPLDRKLFAVFYVVSHLILPYFLCWSMIYLGFGWLYLKTQKPYLIFIFGVLIFLLKLAYIPIGLMYISSL